MSVEIEHLTVRFGETSALSDVSVCVPDGRWLGIIGPNGAGKSTLLRAVCGLVAHEGSIRVDARRVGGGRTASRAVAYVPQRPVLPPAMRVADYVMLGRTPHISLFSMESRRDHEVVASVMERLELSTLTTRALGELSGGEAQRAVLARALAQEAPILLLDEPTSALDLGHAQRVLKLTDELRRERSLTVLCAMHDLTSAGQFADELLLLVSGQTIIVNNAAVVLTESRIGEVYGAPVRVINDPAAGLVVAIRRDEANRATKTDHFPNDGARHL